MKKLVIAVALASASIAATATEVGVSAVRDFSGADANGHRITAGIGGVSLSATHINNRHNRYAVGKDFQVYKLGPVALSAGAAGVYQDTDKGRDGYGLTLGTKATVGVTKSIDAVLGVERFVGQDRVKQYNGNLVTAGVSFKF